ncbi:DUF2065 domain-containing protein [Colwellia sp. KU-HH00111]|uniref:DUF2065 domain-containing protein n=1 Tax=Colwellia sp. KU-HH00111 TaxID=3127652 RepID=UPI003109B15D
MAESLLLAFGLMLVIEGLAPALFPNKWRRYLLKMTEQPTQVIRNMGISILLLGVMVLWLSQ